MDTVNQWRYHFQTKNLQYYRYYCNTGTYCKMNLKIYFTSACNVRFSVYIRESNVEMGEMLHLLSTTVSQNVFQLIEHRAIYTRIQYIMYTRIGQNAVLELTIQRFLRRSGLNTFFVTETTCTTFCKNVPLGLTNNTK
jgi:hypothetical protein